MSNTIQVLTFITNDMLRQTKNNLQFVKNLAGEDFANMFTSTPKKGSSFSIRKSTRFVGRSGETFSAEDYKERSVTMTVGTTLGVDLSFTNRELMLELEQISQRVVKPAAESLASLIDTTYLLAAVNATHNQVGTPGTIPTSLKTYNQARAKQSWESCPNAGHALLITPDMQVEAVEAGKSFFGSHADDQYDTGLLGKHSGAKVYEVQNLPVHVNGAYVGTPLTNGATADGATSVVTDGWTGSVTGLLKKGDVITFAGVYAVNPWTRATTGALRQFTVTADVDSTTGAATIPVSPAIIASGPFQNVTNVPADNSAVVVAGAASLAYPVGLRFHRDAFVFGTLSQPNPEGAVTFCKSVTDPQTGITIRYIRDWNTEANKQIDRFDVVPAWGVAFPEFACRVAS